MFFPQKNGVINLLILSSILGSEGSEFEFFALCFLCDSIGSTYPIFSFAFFIGKMRIHISCLSVLLVVVIVTQRAIR